MDTTKTPTRIQRKRTKGWKMPYNTVYVGRGSKWGNPYKVGEKYPRMRSVAGGPHLALGDPEPIIDRFDAVFEFLWLTNPFIKRDGLPAYPTIEEVRAELAGKNLACWCPLTDAHGNHVPCHADVLLEIANQ